MQSMPIVSKRPVEVPLPVIDGTESFDELAGRISVYVVSIVRRTATFEEIVAYYRTPLDRLCTYFIRDVQHVNLVSALITLRSHFHSRTSEDVEGLNITQAAFCEHAALQYAFNLSQRDLIESLLLNVTGPESSISPSGLSFFGRVSNGKPRHDERSPLLVNHSNSYPQAFEQTNWLDGAAEPAVEVLQSNEMNLSEHVQGLNALEVAAVTGAKKFLGAKPVQQIITAIWNGDVVFWSEMSTDARKHPHVYNPRTGDVYSRLRVPKYLKAFEAFYFTLFMGLYYIVLVERSFDRITVAEVLLDIWLGSFAYNELAEFWDAGTAFYLSDFWAMWDVGIILTGVAFVVCRLIGLHTAHERLENVAFDILAMEALFLVPRFFSLLSLHPYFGTLLPCLREMTKDFLKFLSLVVILHIGFLTTFSLLARDQFTFRDMSWILIKVFFGSSYLGFDVADQISPLLGPALMLVFVCITNILLITSLTAILSNTLDRVIEHASDEYKFVYSVFVLEASASNRLTYFFPPLNLIPLLLRPLRLCLSADRLRAVRIFLLKVTHFPHIIAIKLYERCNRRSGLRPMNGLSFSIDNALRDGPRGMGQQPISKRLSSVKGQDVVLHNQGNSPAFSQQRSKLSAGTDSSSLSDVLSAIRALESTVSHLSKQVEKLSAESSTNVKTY